MGDGGGSDVRRGIDALSAFRDQISRALGNFEGSPGSPSKLEDQALARPSFGGTGAKFDEADNLHAKYGEVHTRLVHFSKVLNLQIEALKLATHAADVTYDGTEEEVRRRFWQIQQQLDDEYEQASKEKRAEDEAAKKAGQAGKQAPKEVHKSTGGSERG
ncbi:hypothetical protein [Streptomyces sp. NPDC005573]|uniref:hypothetical protein n=1 Tax=Streptomyces sp. NPDC005573 TaxID=3156890 RepID=UPI0033A83730